MACVPDVWQSFRPDDLVDCVDNILDVALVEAGKADAAALEQVDGELIGEGSALLCREASEREHTNLIGDVCPRARRALAGEPLDEHAPGPASRTIAFRQGSLTLTLCSVAMLSSPAHSVGIGLGLG